MLNVNHSCSPPFISPLMNFCLGLLLINPTSTSPEQQHVGAGPPVSFIPGLDSDSLLTSPGTFHLPALGI